MCAFEILCIRGHSRSLEMASFYGSYMSSYSSSNCNDDA